MLFEELDLLETNVRPNISLDTFSMKRIGRNGTGVIRGSIGGVRIWARPRVVIGG
jgi:hypothetical protein